MEQDRIIDKLYEAALIPEKWNDLLVTINREVGTFAGVIFTQSEIGRAFIATPEAEEIFQKFIEGGWDKKNSRMERANKLDHAGFLCDLDVFKESELASEPLYRDFLYPHGLGWSVGTHIAVPNGDVLAASFDGKLRDGPIPREKIAWLDAIRPHLARALSMMARLQIATIARIADGLGAFGLPACVVNASGKLLSANSLMEPLIPSVLVDSRARIALRNPGGDALLKQVLGREPTRDGWSDVMSIPVPATEDQPACVVHLLPIRGNGRDLLPRGIFILAVSILASSALPDASLLRGLFDLTPMEAKVARLVALGTSTEEICRLSRISRNTLKSHLKAIYAKTGTDHQAYLVRLLSGAPMPQSWLAHES
ncbi:hypothetical protein CXZ10_13000 [Pleomorphomonas diazotrophica]|uniref:HTH luxR-type domain-containing protein n=1 Tax=Pleomorphomonas diazotrophica TaxID=1166257 RepID=A0A1I4WD58_9HYPH|nr:helix-turn-helix transcriptional regulator [Pleomorphomonas diazotrophica]PKR89019.1 hypothetical protein CXZ10_13000 [Pleomorphomonas diazotrophica]SFN11180.1 DNA-binding transcriptional regulator, CsgD family [Pleomorphomonas diazotrophica]